MTSDEPIDFPDAPRADLDRALKDLVERAGEVMKTQGRLRALLHANRAVVELIELPRVLRRIVDAAVELVDAQYGAIGVIAPQGGLEEFIYVGMTEQDEEVIGHLPEGHGLLGALIDDPRPIRLERISDDRRSVGFPDGHPPMDNFLGVPISVRDRVFGNLYLTGHRNGAFSAEDEQLVISLAATAGFAIENARLFAEAKMRERWMTAASETAAEMLTLSPADGLRIVADRALELADADRATLCERAEDNGLAHSVVYSVGADPTSSALSHPVSAIDSVFRSGSALVLAPAEAIEADYHSLTDGHRGGSLLAVPISLRGQVIRVLVLARYPGRPGFSASELDIAADFVSRACVALELADARENQERVTLLEDRGRIARDLHDHVIQQLFGTGLELQGVASRLGPSEISDMIAGAITRIDDSIAQIRTVVFALSAPRFPDASIRHALLDLVSEAGSGLLTQPTTSFAGPVDLVVRDSLALDVVAVARESLTNIVKHAHATRVTVDLTASDGMVTLEVHDDGIGIPAVGRRSGIANMHHRAKQRGGECEVNSEPGSTLIRWSVPYPELTSKEQGGDHDPHVLG